MRISNQISMKYVLSVFVLNLCISLRISRFQETISNKPFMLLLLLNILLLE